MAAAKKPDTSGKKASDTMKDPKASKEEKSAAAKSLASKKKK